MYVLQIEYPGWYIDAITSELYELPIKYIPFITTVGVIDEVSMCRIIIGLRRSKSPNFRRSLRLLPTRERGEETDKATRRVLIGQTSGNVWTPVTNADFEYGSVLRELRGHVMGDNMEPWERGRERSHGNSYDRVIKLDIDVSVEYYDVNRLVKDKITMLHALGYKEEKVETKLSPSGKHLHIIITLDHEIPLEELFYLQFALGDDPKRAEFNFFRLKHFPQYAKRFNVLFSKKEKLTWKKKIRVIAHAILKKITR